MTKGSFDEVVHRMKDSDGTLKLVENEIGWKFWATTHKGFVSFVLSGREERFRTKVYELLADLYRNDAPLATVGDCYLVNSRVTLSPIYVAHNLLLLKEWGYITIPEQPDRLYHNETWTVDDRREIELTDVIKEWVDAQL